MKKILLTLLILPFYLFLFVVSVHASTTITITHIDDLNYSDPNQYKFAIFFTPKINTFITNSFSGCAFIYNYSNFNRFSSVNWNNDASSTESSCTFQETRNSSAGVDNNFSGKLNIYESPNGAPFNPSGVSDFYNLTIPGKPDQSPVVNDLPGSAHPMINEDDTYSGTVSFTDSDSESWTAAINYGDGSPIENQNLTTNSVTISHSYPNYGSYPVSVTITDNQGQSATKTKTIKVNYYTSHLKYLQTTTVENNNGMTNPEGLLVQNDDSFALINSSSASVKVNLSPQSFAPRNIYALSMPVYYRQDTGRPNTHCFVTINTDQGDIHASGCNFADPASYSDNAGLYYTFQQDNIHQINYLIYSVVSSSGETTPLEIDFLEPRVFYSNNHIPSMSIGGPYTVPSGGSIMLQPVVTDVENDPIQYSWDFFNDGTFEYFTQNPTFSAENLSPGVYPIRMLLSETNSSYELLGDVTVTSPVPSPTPTPTPAPTTLSPTADTYIKEGSKNENEGGSAFMRIQSAGNNRGLIRFDQAQIVAAVGSRQNYSARLRLTISSNGNNWGKTGRQIDLNRLTTDWVEGNGFIDGHIDPVFRGSGSGATWNCAIDSIISNTATNCGSSAWNMTSAAQWPFVPTPTASTIISNNQAGVVEFNVTSDIQSFIANSNQNYGWVIRKNNEDQNGKVQFSTRETSTKPELVITTN